MMDGWCFPPMIIVRSLIMDQPIISPIFILGQYGKVKAKNHL